MKTFLMIMLAGLPVLGADPAGVSVWRSSELKAYGQKLAPKMNQLKLANEQIGNWGNHSMMAVHREGNGEAELHVVQADIFIVQSGEASFVVGGELVGGKTTAPGEIRGPSIKGGRTVKLGAGDIVHVPPKVAHQVLVAPGQKFTYMIVKVDQK
jgi:mannose-6-phosphate isomerase-like protein (cupin superfamily)